MLGGGREPQVERQTDNVRGSPGEDSQGGIVLPERTDVSRGLCVNIPLIKPSSSLSTCSPPVTSGMRPKQTG